MEEVLATWPAPAREMALVLRRLIHDEAARLSVGPLTETLKWGEPAFLTEQARSGTTLRLGWKAKAPEALRLLVPCQTDLVDRWRDRFPELAFEGNRALVLPIAQPLPEAPLRACIAMTLTYHRDKVRA